MPEAACGCEAPAMGTDAWLTNCPCRELEPRRSKRLYRKQATSLNGPGSFGVDVTGIAPEDYKEKTRQARFLAARGFGFDMIERVFDKAREEACKDEDD